MSDEEKVVAEEVEPGANSRRDFLKKSIAVGGALWAAPAIASLPGGAAFGQNGSPVPGCPGGCSGTAFGVFEGLIGPTTLPAAAGPCEGEPFGAGNCVAPVTIGGATDPGAVSAQIACGCVTFSDTDSEDTCTAHGEVLGLSARLGDALDPDLLITADILASQTSQSCPDCTIFRSSTITTLFVNGTLIDTSGIQPNSVILVDGLRIVINEQGCTDDGNPFTAALTVYDDGGLFLPAGSVLLRFGYSEAGATDCPCTAPGEGPDVTPV